MTAPSATPRRIQVEALSAQTELLYVVRVGMAITVVVWMYVALVAGGTAKTPQRNLLPFQKLIADRPPEEQRMFRELQEGLLEAEAVRGSATAWPTTEGSGVSEVMVVVVSALSTWWPAVPELPLKLVSPA